MTPDRDNPNALCSSSIIIRRDLAEVLLHEHPRGNGEPLLRVRKSASQGGNVRTAPEAVPVN
jgi:hypothetical protein